MPRSRSAGAAELTSAARRLDGDRGTTFVQSLERGLAVIRTFEHGSASTPSEVAAATGLTRAAARRFLLTLADLGYVRAEGRAFRLSPRVLELGRAYLSGLTLPDLALPHLRELVASVRESSSVAVLDGERIVYIAHVAAKRVLAVTVTVGSEDPAWATSLGRVLLAAQSDEWLDRYLERAELPALTARTITQRGRLRAELEKVRKQGWALVDQELEVGLRAVAAPIHDAHGRVVAAVNVDPQATRWTVGAIRSTVLPQLLEKAAAIDVELASVDGARRGVGQPRSAGPDEELRAKRGSDFVQSLERGLAVIRAFDGSAVADVERGGCGERADTRGGAAVPAHARRARLRRLGGARLLADAARAGARACLRLHADAPGGCAAAPARPRDGGARVVDGRRSRPRADHLHRPRPRQPRRFRSP